MIKSFAKLGVLKKIEVLSSGDEMSGEVEPEVRLVIAENAAASKSQKRYLLAVPNKTRVLLRIRKDLSF